MDLKDDLVSQKDDIARLLEDAKHVAGSEIVRRAAAELPGAIDRLVLQRYRALVLFNSALIVGAFAAGCWITYLVRG